MENKMIIRCYCDECEHNNNMWNICLKEKELHIDSNKKCMDFVHREVI